MSQEEKTPYFSKRVRIADIKSPKEYIGFKERTIEVTFGNSSETIVYKNPNDLGDTESHDMKEMILELFKMTDDIATERGFKFMDKAGGTN